MKINRFYPRIADIYINDKVVGIYIIKQKNNLYLVNVDDLNNKNLTLKDIVERNLYYEKIKNIRNATKFINSFFDVKIIYDIELCDECKKPFRTDYHEPIVNYRTICEKCFDRNPFEDEVPW